MRCLFSLLCFDLGLWGEMCAVFKIQTELAMDLSINRWEHSLDPEDTGLITTKWAQQGLNLAYWCERGIAGYP